MFFPCTHKENVNIDYSADISGQSTNRRSSSRKRTQLEPDDQNKDSVNLSERTSSQDNLLDGKSDQTYLTKPTIIMCNPNALVYQQM
jgi:predicted acyl esterase